MARMRFLSDKASLRIKNSWSSFVKISLVTLLSLSCEPHGEYRGKRRHAHGNVEAVTKMPTQSQSKRGLARTHGPVLSCVHSFFSFFHCPKIREKSAFTLRSRR
jgi:hypothetical protein